MSGTMTGCHVGVRLKNPFTFEGSRQAMCRTHKCSGCMDAKELPRHPGTLFLGYFLWGEQQEVTRHMGETNIKKPLDSRFHGNDGY